MGAGGGPFIADGEGEVNEFANEDFCVAVYGYDDGLGYGLGEGLVCDFADDFFFELYAAVDVVAVGLVFG